MCLGTGPRGWEPRGCWGSTGAGCEVPVTPRDIPALRGSLEARGMSPGIRRGSGSVPRPEVTGIVPLGCHRRSSGDTAAPPSLGTGLNGGATAAGDAGAGALHPLPQGIASPPPPLRAVDAQALFAGFGEFFPWLWGLHPRCGCTSPPRHLHTPVLLNLGS